MGKIRTSQQLQQLFQKSKEEKEKQTLEKQELMRLKRSESQKKYRDKHKVEAKLYFLLYRQKNKERLRAYQAEYRKREGNREKNIAYQEIYRQNHKEIRVIDENTNTVKRVSESIESPPIKSKKQLKELYQKWLKNLQIMEPHLTGFKLYCNQLMQESLKQTLMGRKKLSIEQVRDKVKDLQELIADLQERRRQTTNDEEKNDLTKKIALANGNLSTYKRKYKSLFPKPKKEKPLITRSIVRNKLEEIEQKAKQLIANAKDDKEKKMWEERLMIVKLRYKYSYC